MNKKLLILGGVGLAAVIVAFLLLLPWLHHNHKQGPEILKREINEVWQVHHISINEENTDSFDKLLYLKYDNVLAPPFMWDGQKILLLKETQDILKSTDENAKKREAMNLVTDVTDIREARYFITYSINFNGNGRRDSLRHYFILKNLPYGIFKTSAWDKNELLIERGSSILKTLEIRLLGGELSILELNTNGELKVEHAGNQYTIKNNKENILDNQTRKVSIKEERLKPIPIEATQVEKLEYEIYDYGTIAFKTQLVVSNIGIVPIQLR